MKPTWIVAADKVRARIFETSSNSDPLEEVKDFINPDGDKQDHELLSDRPGRTHDSLGAGRHSMEPNTSPSKKITQLFIHEVMHYVETAHFNHKFDRLIIVAAPEILGALRAELSVSLARMVILEIAKDYSMLNPLELRAQLPEHLFLTLERES